MNLTELTKIGELFEAHPDLKEKLTSVLPQAKVLATPLAQTLLKNATVADIAQKIGIPTDDLLKKLTELIGK